VLPEGSASSPVHPFTGHSCRRYPVFTYHHLSIDALAGNGAKASDIATVKAEGDTGVRTRFGKRGTGWVRNHERLAKPTRLRFLRSVRIKLLDRIAIQLKTSAVAIHAQAPAGRAVDPAQKIFY
jgi:hypothetical protein